MPDGATATAEDQYTDAQLSDGTTLRFKGQLQPEEVKQKVAAYRTKQAPAQNAANLARNAQPTEFEKQNTPTFFGEAARTAAKIPLKTLGFDTNAPTKSLTDNPSVNWLKQNAGYALNAINPARIGPPKVLSDVVQGMNDTSREGAVIRKTGRSVEPAAASETGAMQARPGGPVTKLGEELSHPQLAGAVRTAASMLPILGPGAVHAGHAAARATNLQEGGEAAADIGGVVGQAALATKPGQEFTNKAIETIGKPVARAGEITAGFGAKAMKAAAAPYTIGLSGESMLKKGLAPYAKQTGYDAAMKQAANDIVKYHEETPIRSVKDLHEALPEIEQRIAEERMNPVARRHASEVLPQERFDRAKAAVESAATPFVEEFEPEAAKEVKTLAEKIGKARTVGDLIGTTAGDRGGLLGYINAKMNSYFAKYPSARGIDLMTNPDTAAWEAARRSLREEVMDHLEQQGETDIGEARKTYGALKELQKTTERRINVADRAKPMSLSRILGLVGAAPTGGLSVIAGEVAHHLNKPDVLVRRGIERMAKNAPGISPEMGQKALQAAKGPAELPTYKPSEKAATMGGERKNLGPEFEAGEVSHEIERNKSILRNSKATAENRSVARAKLRELQAQP